MPFQRSSVPLAPTITTSVALSPCTLYSSSALGTMTRDHVLPTRRSTSPLAPTAYTTLSPPHTPFMVCVELVVSVLHVLVASRNTVPLLPAAHATVWLSTQMALSVCVVPEVIVLHAVPFQRAMAPAVPTAMMFVADEPWSAVKSASLDSDSVHVVPFQR